MDIHIEPGDAGLLVDMLLEQRRTQTAMANLHHATDAERELAELKADAATRIIAGIRQELEMRT